MVQVLERAQDEDGGDVAAAASREAPGATAGPGMRAIARLAEGGAPTPAELSDLLESHPAERNEMAAFVQQRLGNHVAAQALAGDGAAAHRVGGPLAPALDLDASAAIARLLARGWDDENQLTNEVFWLGHPAIRGVELEPGTPAAREWLRVRDHDVRPALAAHLRPDAAAAVAPAPEITPDRPADVERAAAPTPNEVVPVATAREAAKVTAGGDGGESTRASATASTKVTDTASASATATATASATATAGKSTPEVDALLAWTPVGVSGPQGQAAWLRAAIATGLITAGDADDQLERLAAGKTSVLSHEKNPDAVRTPLDNTRKVKDSGKGYGTYQIEIPDAPILEVLVTLAAGKLRRWVAEGTGEPRVLFKLGKLARADMGFGFRSPHAQGHAIDIGFADKKAFHSADEVIELLECLEPGKVGSVFPDNHDHIHLGWDGKEYSFGLPFQGDFFPGRDLDEQLAAATTKVAAPTDGQTVSKTGLHKFDGHIMERTATFQAATGKWKWSKPKVAGGAAIKKLQNPRLKELLGELGSKPSSTPAAAKDEHGEVDVVESDAAMAAPDHAGAAGEHGPRCGPGCGHAQADIANAD